MMFIDAIDSQVRKRVRSLNTVDGWQGKSVLYVMSREQRVQDNWALIVAQRVAITYKVPLVVGFHVISGPGYGVLQQYEFMFEGLDEVSRQLAVLHIPFEVVSGNWLGLMREWMRRIEPGLVVFDMSPLRCSRKKHREFAELELSACVEVDSHNIVPVWLASNKQEWAAYTLRPKIKRVWEEYLLEPPKLVRHPYSILSSNDFKRDVWLERIRLSRLSGYIPGYRGGESAAQEVMKTFLKEQLKNYGRDRNDPTKYALSGLSPYLHFGMLASLRVALLLQKTVVDSDDQLVCSSGEEFWEELVVRKELADNYCYYNSNYDVWDGIPEWGKQTLNDHRGDHRRYVYTLDQFESARTHDQYWNAAQIQLLKTGKIHSYMRMYWAKKILEWSESPETAIVIAVYLNDTYHLDGRDPNGYVGILWCIGGLHDRPWPEREIYGKVRSMTDSGLKRKFDVELYVQKWLNVSDGEVK